ncbi:DUF4178 domain-containing protein [Mangrovibacillus cuniculi]|uniref:DUF4178 domain-containing protein n=1 Tax=Mangrovibacillus cuniculi TaxID=2593652 RepID=A0A7S8CDI9_9BACI|nr:DUF4178 domain-containing protein [Mangrovibacillus cuniculi]QPC47803.1 DUF4178 domain-containing protein [Mangrovibacillus cuniculi]
MNIFKKIFGGNKAIDNPIQERTLHTIQVGDIVTYDLVDYQVVGVMTYRQNRYEWKAYQLENVSGTKWLSVEQDDELEVGIYEKIKLRLTEPLPEEITHSRRTYYFDERGVARVTGQGRSQAVTGQECRYAGYTDEEEENYLSVEIWGSEIEVSAGYGIEPYEIKILAGTAN